MKLLIWIMLGAMALAQNTQEKVGSSGERRPTPALRLFTPGLTHAQVVARFGEANTYYATPVVTRAVAPGSAWRLASRASGEYRIEVSYEVDDSKSRLHPQLRVSEVQFIPDKHLTAAQVLNELPEARALCIAGCDLRTSNAGSDVLNVCPTADSAERMKLPLHSVMALHAAASGSMSGLDDEPECATLWIYGTYGCDGRVVAAWEPQ